VCAGSLVVTDDAPGSPQQVSLSGTGISSSLALGVAPGGSSSATVAAGAMATYKLSIGGSGFSGIASLTCTGAPQAANCSFPSCERCLEGGEVRVVSSRRSEAVVTYVLD